MILQVTLTCRSARKLRVKEEVWAFRPVYSKSLLSYDILNGDTTSWREVNELDASWIRLPGVRWMNSTLHGYDFLAWGEWTRRFMEISMPITVLPFLYISILKQESVPLQARSGPECSRKIRFPDFMTTAQEGGKVVSLTHRPHLPPANSPGTHLC